MRTGSIQGPRSIDDAPAEPCLGPIGRNVQGTERPCLNDDATVKTVMECRLGIEVEVEQEQAHRMRRKPSDQLSSVWIRVTVVA